MKLKTGISPNYVKDWDIEKAIREILQNYLDARQEFNVKGRVDYRSGAVTVHDYGPGLEMKHLALGMSEKDNTLRGKFGEGLKLALLVFAREGREIVVRSKGREIRPLIEVSEGFGAEVLVLEVTPAQTPKGTQVRFPCTRGELEAGKSYFVEFERQRPEFKRVADRVTLPGGYVYINGTKVGELSNALFSYHLNESEVGGAGNRDRTVVDMNKVKPAIEGILESATTGAFIRAIWKGITSKKDPPPWEMFLNVCWYGKTTDLSRRAWARGFTHVFGKNAVLPSGKVLVDSETEYDGYKVIRLPLSWEYFATGCGVPVAGKHHGDGQKPKVIRMTQLSQEEASALTKATVLCEHFYRPPGEVAVVESLVGFLGANSNATAEGGYDPEEGVIYIAKNTLKDFKKLFHILLHEAVHKHTGYGDRSEQFEGALLDIAVNIITGGDSNDK